MKKIVSIIIPVYNSERYLSESVKSALSQTYRDIEVIIVDDGSTDNTISIAEELARDDGRIKVFHKKNEGPGKARLFGVKKSTGGYIMFLDSDDYLTENAVSKVVNVMNMGAADIVRFHAMRYPGNKIVEKIEIEGDCAKISHEKAIELLATTDTLSSMCFQCYNRDCFNEISMPKNLVYCEDYLINQRIHKKDRRVIAISDILYNYRHNPDSTTRTHNTPELIRNLRDRIFACRETIMMINDETMPEAKKSIARGFQIERIRRDLIKILIQNKNNKVTNGAVFLDLSRQYSEMLSEVKQEDVDAYIKSMGFIRRVLNARMIRAMYMNNENAIRKNIARCETIERMRRFIR